MDSPPPRDTIMYREQAELEQEPKRQGQYFTFNDDRDDDSQFYAYIVPPDTGVYRFKLVKLHVKMSDRFPRCPPQVRFIHNTRQHIHPNFFESGHMCIDLFKDRNHETWREWYPQWSHNNKICHNLLLYIRDLLDDKPFKREPWGRDNPELTRFVQYVTWDALLLKYIATETHNEALVWLREYVEERGVAMLCELSNQKDADRGREYFTGPYHEKIPADYPALTRQLGEAVARARATPRPILFRGDLYSHELEMRKIAAWTFAGRLRQSWTRLFCSHPDRYV